MAVEWLDTWPVWWGLVVSVLLVGIALVAHFIAPSGLGKHVHVTGFLVFWAFFFALVVSGTVYAAMSPSRAIKVKTVTVSSDGNSVSGSFSRDDGGADITFTDLKVGESTSDLGLQGLVAPNIHDYVVGREMQLAFGVANDATEITSDAQVYRSRFTGSAGLWGGLGITLVVLFGVMGGVFHFKRDFIAKTLKLPTLDLPKWARSRVAE